MLMIRLQRVGKTKRPTYRLIVSPKHKDTQSGQIEILGQYDPVQKK
jgi:ribosomal protein S16